MKQSTTLLPILESIIFEEDIQTILAKHEYQDTARKFKVQTLLHMLVTAAAHQWESFRHGADVVSFYGRILELKYRSLGKQEWKDTKCQSTGTDKRICYRVIIDECHQKLNMCLA